MPLQLPQLSGLPKQKIIPLAISILLGVAAVYLVKGYVDQQRLIVIAEAKKQLVAIQKSMQTNQAAVVIARVDISKGATISAKNIDIAIVPKQAIRPGVIAALEDITGLTVTAAISKGEQITQDKLSKEGRAVGTGKEVRVSGGELSLSKVTPPGKRAITISIDNTSPLGMIKSGDYVDMIAMLPVPVKTPEGKQIVKTSTVPLFQNVLILATGQEIAKQPGAPREAGNLITLALTPQEANILAFVQEQGKVRLTLRSPGDTQIQQAEPATWDTLFKYLPKEVSAQLRGEEKKPEPEAAAETGPYVEIYRGLNKERVPLTK